MPVGRANGPGIHVPPPLLFLAGAGAAWALESWAVRLPLSGGLVPDDGLDSAGGALVLAGLALGLWGVLTFRRWKTAILPFHPASTVVQSGPYRFTRNPMYLGLSLAYAGLALVLDSGWALLLLPPVLLLLVRLVIRKEEAYLEAAFGETYRAYRRRVRRWI